MPEFTRINLALQGGGSHGAFTWGVLDALLEDRRLSFEGLSGTSAGAMNVAALASGWAVARRANRDPREGAREALAAFWDEVATLGAAGSVHRKLFASLWGLSPLGAFGFVPSQPISPYQFNPLDLNPLRDLLERRIDFAAIRAQHTHRLYVSATEVETGRAQIFTGAALTADAVMASACLPQLWRATVIGGQPYWDGGYSANPAITPLLTLSESRDVLLVQINPLRREEVPREGGDIVDRMAELAFNASLLTQMRQLHAWNQLAERGAAAGRGAMRVHRVDGGRVLEELPQSSRTTADPVLVRRLFKAGREAAQAWCDANHGDVGRRSTVDLRKEYGDGTWLQLAAPPAPAVRRLRPRRMLLKSRPRIDGRKR
ncbi:patatin-like phospholipase family protein [Ramlibacter humi]|uniref:Patatin-like phospholipase family protein n=1 Tax=Ramlibacter humi TaxID=2530451 RepID=A0A4Z0CD70_9BURK|nr:patatin-like phospholipase family protein [Ramlibacter humi]TFZ08390.1 patatin-like phospholipase family protein [Ramlibacter humi]